MTKTCLFCNSNLAPVNNFTYKCNVCYKSGINTEYFFLYDKLYIITLSDKNNIYQIFFKQDIENSDCRQLIIDCNSTRYESVNLSPFKIYEDMKLLHLFT
jgi:hypothetical protein